MLTLNLLSNFKYHPKPSIFHKSFTLAPLKSISIKPTPNFTKSHNNSTFSSTFYKNNQNPILFSSKNDSFEPEKIEKVEKTNKTMDQLKDNHEDEFWPLTGAPYFSMILTRTHTKPAYQMTLPVKIQVPLSDLPNPVPVVLSYRGKKWDMTYVNKRFDSKWREFAMDNNLNAGDAIVFEMTKSSNTLVEFGVQILRGDFPSELLANEEGESPNTPITIV